MLPRRTNKIFWMLCVLHTCKWKSKYATLKKQILEIFFGHSRNGRKWNKIDVKKIASTQSATEVILRKIYKVLNRGLFWLPVLDLNTALKGSKSQVDISNTIPLNYSTVPFYSRRGSRKDRIAQCGMFRNLSLILNTFHRLCFIYAMYYIVHLCLKSVICKVVKVVFLKRSQGKRDKSILLWSKTFSSKIKTKRISLSGGPKEGPDLLTDTATGCLEHKNMQGKRSWSSPESGSKCQMTGNVTVKPGGKVFFS